MKIKKLLSVILAVLLCFGSMTMIASAEGSEEDSDFVDTPTLPMVEEVEVSVVYRPLKSMISFADFGPLLDGVILKVTYSDGTSELITLEKAQDETWGYVAGDYYVYFSYFNTAEVRSPGINSKRIIIDGFKNDINYSGEYKNFKYLYIPSLGECLYLLSSLIRIYNPIT